MDGRIIYSIIYLHMATLHSCAFHYCALLQVRSGSLPTFEFCGFDLSKDEKDRLLARWAREYPELPEGVGQGCESLRSDENFRGLIYP